MVVINHRNLPFTSIGLDALHEESPQHCVHAFLHLLKMWEKTINGAWKELATYLSPVKVNDKVKFSWVFRSSIHISRHTSQFAWKLKWVEVFWRSGQFLHRIKKAAETHQLQETSRRSRLGIQWLRLNHHAFGCRHQGLMRCNGACLVPGHALPPW